LDELGDVAVGILDLAGQLPATDVVDILVHLGVAVGVEVILLLLLLLLLLLRSVTSDGC
jgi:hypothetical protein